MSDSAIWFAAYLAAIVAGNDMPLNTAARAVEDYRNKFGEDDGEYGDDSAGTGG